MLALAKKEQSASFSSCSGSVEFLYGIYGSGYRDLLLKSKDPSPDLTIICEVPVGTWD
jgi:hypothetical protein